MKRLSLLKYQISKNKASFMNCYASYGKNALFVNNIQRNFSSKLNEVASEHLEAIKQAGTFKVERPLVSPQGNEIIVNGKKMLNFCANNYQHLANNKEIIERSIQDVKEKGFGMASVRFICGTQDLHLELEDKISAFHKKEAGILYTSCFDANAGIFEVLLNNQDVIFSDALNHASIIDGMRLCKAKKEIYKHLDMEDLENRLKNSGDARIKLIVTDGVFSMDGDITPLDKIVELAKKYDASVFLDECHAAGVLGKTGRGVPELFGLEKEVDIINGTFGKALSGGSGGYTVGPKPIIDLLRQKSRPYLFSNSLSPIIVGGTLKTLEILDNSPERFTNLHNNTVYFREKIKAMGFTILGHPSCPIVPVLVGDDKVANEFGVEMGNEGIYVVGFFFPVVPKGKARIRVQINAEHTKEHLDFALKAFEKLGKKYSLI